MKYKKSIYEGFELSPMDRDTNIRNKTQKVVITKKLHLCWICGHEYPIKTEMLRERAFVDGKPSTCYACLDCVDKCIDEVNQTGKE